MVFWWKGMRSVGREKDMMELTRWTVSTTVRRRRSLKEKNAELVIERIILTCEKCAVSAA